MPAKHATALRFLQWSAGRDRTEDIKERCIGAGAPTAASEGTFMM
ncbi:MAG TPA: hypothetical protein VIH78_10955 [Terriglobales bacterium]